MGYLDMIDPTELTLNERMERETIHPYCSKCGINELGSQAQLRQAGWVFDVDGNDLCSKHNPYNIDRPAVLEHYKGLNEELKTGVVHHCSLCMKQAIDRADAALEFIPTDGREIDFDELIDGMTFDDYEGNLCHNPECDQCESERREARERRRW